MPGCRTSSDVMSLRGGVIINRASPQADGLVGWWPLRNVNASSEFDASGNHLTGSYSSAATSKATEEGQVLDTTGSRRLLSIPYDSRLDITTDLSLSAWLLPTVVNTADGALIIGMRSPSSPSSNFPYNFWINTSKLFFQYYDGTGYHNATDTTTLVVGTKYLVEVTHDISANLVTFYINGVKSSEHTLSGAPASAGSPIAMEIGSYSLSTNTFGYNGLLWDVRAYKKCRVQSEVSQSYASLSRYDLYWRKSRSAPKYVSAAGGVFTPYYYREHIARAG